MVVVTLTYQDGSIWIAGGFSSLADAQRWIAEEQAKSYWNSNTQVQTVDHSQLN